ncbi:DUF3037 domain-containing protein [Arcticibacter sp.]|jgi:hypothetical protein|uniref:DUF3037 domain-containing protein n=1 Tax=Arcticibacter sp. TaxID=1872630 RepID=UPI00388E1DD0
MQDKHLFEYAVIRLVPRVEREEFLNVGVILYCKSSRFLQMTMTIDRQRLLAFAPDTDLQMVEQNLNAFAKICAGGKDGGPIGQQTMADRFRWITAMRSTIIQTSRVHPGFCTDPQSTLERLHSELVL